VDHIQAKFSAHFLPVVVDVSIAEIGDKTSNTVLGGNKLFFGATINLRLTTDETELDATKMRE
jgi:hypothetical protein